MANIDRFRVGTIVAPQGLRGDVRILSHTSFPDVRFVAGSVLLLRDRSGAECEVEVASARRHRGVYVVHLAGVDAIERAEALRGAELFVTRDQLLPMQEGEYLISDLIGCDVVADGELFGVLEDVLQPGANDVYVVRRRDGSTALLPAIPDCIKRVDVAARKVEAAIMPGLLD
jgi:16S rRNA processing protein RimM